MKGKMEIYYDEELDYLEVLIQNPPPNYGEDIAEDITLFKDEKTDEIVGIGIQEFKEKAKNLQDIKIDIPIEINFSLLKSQIQKTAN